MVLKKYRYEIERAFKTREYKIIPLSEFDYYAMEVESGQEMPFDKKFIWIGTLKELNEMEKKCLEQE